MSLKKSNLYGQILDAKVLSITLVNAARAGSVNELNCTNIRILNSIHITYNKRLCLRFCPQHQKKNSANSTQLASTLFCKALRKDSRPESDRPKH